jgi:hypothetical protein
MSAFLDITEPISEDWQRIIDFLSLHKDEKKNPPKAWFKELSVLIGQTVGTAAYEQMLVDTLSQGKKNLSSYFDLPYHTPNPYLLAKGFINSCELFSSQAKVINLLEDIGIAAFAAGNSGIPIGNDCLSVLSNQEVEKSISSLGKYRTRIKKPKVQTKIITLLNGIGKKYGKSADELEELATGSFQLNQAHEFITTFGDWTAQVSFKEVDKSEVNWLQGSKSQKSTPKDIATVYKTELKEWNEHVKEIKEQIKSQSLRIELLYLKNKTWTWGYWKKYYLDHALVGLVAKDLIWQVAWDTHEMSVKYTERGFINSAQQVVEAIPEEAKVKLWHPIYSTVQEIRSWRTYLSDNQVFQAFKQAFREVYLLTDAELNTKSYSNRYAAHIIKVGTYLSRSRSKGWSGSAMIMENFALKIPAYAMRAEYWIQAVKTERDDEIFGSGLGATDQVRFYQEKVQMDLANVPSIVFSEVMRDIDLFISSASITNNPYWTDRGDSENFRYWHKYSFGELRMSGKIRSEVLQTIIPKLPFHGNYSFQDNFLCIQGKIRKYKIHIGSGNILMEPNDQYLCIVPDSSKKQWMEKIFLPFEGDETLSIIISKALLLVKDDEITDSTIVSQINNGK